MMIRSASVTAALAALVAAIPALAGGLYVMLGNPQANEQARRLGAVVTLKLAGCHEPEKAQVSAAAIGTVNGKRHTISLQLAKLDAAGNFAVTRQWPAEGRWVLQFVARDGDRVTTTLVAAGPGGVVEREHARMEMALLSERDIDSLLARSGK